MARFLKILHSPSTQMLGLFFESTMSILSNSFRDNWKTMVTVETTTQIS
jgi:hypothetical protein